MDVGCCISWYTVYSAAEVAAETATRVLPEGGWVFSVSMLGVLVLNKEVVLGVGLRAVECLIQCIAFVRCVAYLYFKLAGVRCCRSCWCGFCC